MSVNPSQEAGERGNPSKEKKRVLHFCNGYQKDGRFLSGSKIGPASIPHKERKGETEDIQTGRKPKHDVKFT
jgi:hypothetical protein